MTLITEQWEKWEPIPGLANKYYIDSIFDELKGFTIILSDAIDEAKKVRIIFHDSVDSYRRTDETFRFETIDKLDEQYGVNFYGKWTFFKVINSNYINWLSQQSYGISDERSFMHFVFIATDSILDVIANYEPHVEMFESK